MLLLPLLVAIPVQVLIVEKNAFWLHVIFFFILPDPNIFNVATDQIPTEVALIVVVVVENVITIIFIIVKFVVARTAA